MKILSVITFLLTAFALPALQITSHQSGAWSAASTWIGGQVPGNGDTVTILNGHTVTIDSTVIIGTSTADNTAILLQDSAALILAEGASLTLRGNLLFSGNPGNHLSLRLDAGSTLEFDASQAASPQQTFFHVGSTANYTYRRIEMNGRLGQRISVRSNPAGGCGWFSKDAQLSQNFNAFGFTASHTDFTRIGDASHDGWANGFQYDSPTERCDWQVSDCTFTACGRINLGLRDMGIHGRFSHNRNIHTDTQSEVVLECQNSWGKNVDGLREIIGNYFDRKLGYQDGYDFLDTTLRGNFFNDHITRFTAGNSDFGGPSTARLEDNFFRFQANSNESIFGILGTISGNYIFIDGMQDNPHWVGPGYYGTGDPVTVNITGNIADFAGTYTTDGGDFITMPPSVSHWNTVNVSRNLILPNRAGQTSANVLTLFGNNTYIDYRVEHNTGFVSGLGIVNLETDVPRAGSLLSMRSNIAWTSPAYAGSVYKIYDVTGGVTRDVANPANIDYNVGFNTGLTAPGQTGCLNQGNGYVANWSVTPPSPHDISADPGFIDPSRNVATFDSTYLGNTQPAWNSFSANNSFAIGDMVSQRIVNHYGNAVINYRAITAHSRNTAGSEPGAGAQWTQYWQLASMYRIREAFKAGTIFQPDAQNGLTTPASIIPTLISWVREGFRPTNPLLQAAAWDGQDIGAVPMTTTTLLRVISPNGGEIWQRGAIQTITWSSVGLSGNVTIELFNGTTRVGAIATVPASPGSYTWTIGTYQGGTATVGPGYLIRISEQK